MLRSRTPLLIMGSRASVYSTAGRASATAAAFAVVGAFVAVLTWPLVTSTSVHSGSSAIERQHETLWHNGPEWVLVLMFGGALLLTLGGMFAALRGRGYRALLGVCAILFVVGSLFTVLTVGWLLLPAAALLVTAALLMARA